MKRLFILFSLGIVIQLLNPQVALAEESPIENVITVSPAFQNVQLEESEPSISKTITVRNISDQAVTLEIIPSNVDQQDLSGRISFEIFSGAANQTFPFLSFSVDRFVLEPRQSQDITVKIDNRSSLRPGGTYVAVVLRSALDAPPTQQVILPAVASLLLINKMGGETYNLSLNEVTGLPKNISLSFPETIGLTFSNQGNTHLQPRGTITVSGLFNRLLAQSSVNESSLYILPGRQRMIQQQLNPASKQLPFDFVWIGIQGTSGNDRTPYSYESSFIYIAPWFIAVVFVVATIIAAVIFWKKSTTAKIST